MKNAYFIILVLLFEPSIAQPSEWNKSAIKENKVKSVKIFTKVPQTNPDYWTSPEHLMLLNEIQFDFEGNTVYSNCINCYVEFDGIRGTGSYNSIDSFFYRKNILVKIKSTDVEKKEIDLFYDSMKNYRAKIQRNISRNRRETITIDYLNKYGNAIKEFEIDFSSVYSSSGSQVNQIFYRKWINEFKGSNKTQINYSSELYSIDYESYNILRYSNDIDIIENLISNFYNKNDDKFIKAGSYVTQYDKSGNIINEGQSSFQISKKNLPEQEVKVWPKFTMVSEFHYEYWD